MELQLLGDLPEDLISRLLDLCRNFLEQFFRIDFVALVIAAEIGLVPGIRISAVAAATDIPLELHTVSHMVALLKALFADDASWILLAVEAAPSHISERQLLRANSRRAILVDERKDLLVLGPLAGSIQLHQTPLEELLQALDDLVPGLSILELGDVEGLQHFLHR